MSREGLTKYLTPEEMHTLQRLTIQSRGVVEGSLAGRHRSPLKGSSTEFAEHKVYTPGDDPRHLDWKVLARTDRYYIRRYEDETILRVYFVLDRSGSMGYTSCNQTKYEYACHLMAAMAYVTVSAKDAAGLYLYSKGIDVMLPPRNSMIHLDHALKTVDRNPPANRSNTAETLHRIAESIRRRALIVLISDLLEDPEEIVEALAHFRKYKHDVILLHTLDPMEIDLSYRKGVEFEDMESGERIVVDPRALAKDYRRVMAEFLETYSKRCTELNIDYRLVKTDQGIENFVRAYLEERNRLSTKSG